MPLQKQYVKDTPQGYITADAPKLFKFDKPGDGFQGKFLSSSVIELTDKETGEMKDVTEYVFEEKDGTILKVLPSYDLLQKLPPTRRGANVIVTYIGTDESVGRNGNAMKVYDVKIRGGNRGDVPSGVAETRITNDDIPF
jgi:hypothetical protein